METGSYHLRFTHIHNAQREPRLHSYKLFLLGHFIAITTVAFYHWQIPIDPTRHQEHCKTPVRSRTDTNTILFENCLFFTPTKSARLLPRRNVFSALTVLPEPPTTLPAVFWLYGFTCAAPLYLPVHAHCVRDPPPLTIEPRNIRVHRIGIEDKKKNILSTMIYSFFFFYLRNAFNHEFYSCLIIIVSIKKILSVNANLY